MKSALIPVRLGPPHEGIVVMHTLEEYERLWRGVDREVCEQMTKPLETNE